jgi:anti-sigma regulatory factor (Ser/Thr protein kinase)
MATILVVDDQPATRSSPSAASCRASCTIAWDRISRSSASTWRSSSVRSRTIKVALSGDGPAYRLEQEIEIALFRIAQEALNNVAKHSRANRVEIELDQSAAQTTLIVSDDGVGFDQEVAPVPGRGNGDDDGAHAIGRRALRGSIGRTRRDAHRDQCVTRFPARRVTFFDAPIPVREAMIARSRWP